MGSSEEVPCQLSILIPFHDDRIIAADNKSTVISSEDSHRDGLTLLASALLAIHDFNNRTSSFAPDALKGIEEDCTIKFPLPKIIDTRQSASTVESTKSSWLPAESGTCSFVIGPANNIAAEVVGQTVNANGTLVISYGADANRLAEDSRSYPNLALANIKWEDYVRSLMQYIKSTGRENVGVLLTPEDNLDFYNTDFFPMWEAVSEDIGVAIKSLSVISYRSKSVLEERLQVLRNARGVRTILVTLHRDDELTLLAEVADSLGMLTDEYTWIITEHFLSSRYVTSYSVPTDSPVAKLFGRTEIFEILDGFSPYAQGEVNSSQLLQIKVLSQSSMLEKNIQSIVNRTAGLQGLVVNQTILDEAFFWNTPVNGVSRIYDAILAAGVSACSGEVSMGSFLKTEFNGVSGKFAYEADSRSLLAAGSQFGVFSIQASENLDCPRCSSGTATFRAKLIHRLVSGIEEAGELQTLSLEVRTYGLSLACIAMFFSIFCGVFVYKFRKNRIVAIGQPEFLGLVCAGSFLIAIPVVLMSFDEGSGWSALYLSIGCTAQIWLKYLGILVVNMALFSKLYRVEQVTQLRRGRRVQVKDVIKPFCSLFAAAFIVLIVWSIVERPVWKREFEIGLCDEDVYFELTMNLIMVIAISLTFVWGHKTRDLPEDISDSKRVHYTLGAQFILLMFDILFSVYTRAINDNTFAYVIDATYTAALSVTCCSYLILPKIYHVYKKSKTGEMPLSLQHGTVRVTGICVPSGATGISGTGRYETTRSRALRATSRASNNNLATSSAASARFVASSSAEKSGSLSIDEVKQASDGSLSSSCRDENHSLRSNPPTTSSFTNRLPTVLDSSLRTSSGLGCEKDVDPVKSVSQPSETVWVQKVEDSKVSLEASSK